MFRLAVPLLSLMLVREAVADTKYLSVGGKYTCQGKAIPGESVVILHRRKHDAPPFAEYDTQVIAARTDEHGHYSLVGSDFVCDNGCDGPFEIGFFVQLTHHCDDGNQAHNVTKPIPKEYENPEANQGKIFKQNFFIWHY
ncbi:hypothetical protein AAVH_28006 [Aphelenchoides avenae]|nr:hypothetical protein AAVH_28006 [Aphelenchus avenae]